MADEQIPEGWGREEWADAERYAAALEQQEADLVAEAEQSAVPCECEACLVRREWKAAVSGQQYQPEGLLQWLEEANRRLAVENPYLSQDYRERLEVLKDRQMFARGPIYIYPVPKDRQEMRRRVSEKLQAVGDALMAAWEERYGQ